MSLRWRRCLRYLPMLYVAFSVIHIYTHIYRHMHIHIRLCCVLPPQVLHCHQSAPSCRKEECTHSAHARQRPGGQPIPMSTSPNVPSRAPAPALPACAAFCKNIAFSGSCNSHRSHVQLAGHQTTGPVRTLLAASLLNKSVTRRIQSAHLRPMSWMPLPKLLSSNAALEPIPQR